MKRVTSFVKDYVRSHDGDKTRTHSLSVVLNTVLDMMTSQRNADGGAVVQGQSDLYQALMLPELADMLLQLIMKKVRSSVNTVFLSYNSLVVACGPRGRGALTLGSTSIFLRIVMVGVPCTSCWFFFFFFNYYLVVLCCTQLKFGGWVKLGPTKTYEVIFW